MDHQPPSLAYALLPDLPILMHGSGDVLPEQVNPQSVAVLAQLVEKYVASLVSAALEAQDVFTDGEVVGGGACLGIPPFERKRKRKEDYWDEPLVEEDDSEDSDDTDSRDGKDKKALLEEPWQGVVPVDIHSTQRTRNYYVSAPSVMDARSFIFPVCHDAVLYQRIKEVQASRRILARDVTESHCLMEVLREEGDTIGRMGMVDMWETVLENKRLVDETLNGDLDKQKMEDSKSSKCSVEKDLATPVIGAGLVDSNNVRASWPDLNPLSRGRLW